MSRIRSFSPGFSIEANGRVWSSAPWRSRVILRDGREVLFSEASVETVPYRTGVGSGYKSIYRGFPGAEGLVLECRLWTEDATGDAIFELIPLGDADVREVLWPEPFANDARESMTVLPVMQGCLIPNYTEEEYLPENWVYYHGTYFEKGRFSCARSMYMQFFGQYDDSGAVMTIFETRFDGGMSTQCGGGKPVLIAPRWRESLGRIGYGRKLRVRFLPAGADYNEIAKAYREYVRSIGELVTLRQKAVSCPNVAGLIGRPIVATYIWYHNAPSSDDYDPEKPEKNDRKQTFSRVCERLRALYARGQRNVAFHLDGWGRRGYDNLHPDELPPAEELGGWEGMKEVQDTCRELGYYFGVHDQYRDYYYDADSFDEALAVRNRDGGVTSHAVWSGGRQTFLCATQAPYYVRRNYSQLQDHGIVPDNIYIDVLSCVELDECFHPEHRMTRQECAAWRLRCFREAAVNGAVLQSEEAVDWAFPGLGFVHWAPHAVRDDRPGEPVGIPIPLLDLVYHDCIITPWTNRFGADKDGSEGEDEGVLMALLHGGASYLNIDAGSDDILQVGKITEWQKEVQEREMLRHAFVDGDPLHQKTWFEGGYAAEVDFKSGTYHLTRP